MLRRNLAVGLLQLFAVAVFAYGQSSSPSAQALASDASLLRPGDYVRLRIWREPDLSGEFQVDENGIVTLPKIGPQKVVGESPVSLKEKLLASYAVYLRNPSVEVTTLRRINILGAVQKPGLYPVDATMTIADALATAGGATAMGDPGKVELIRDGVRTSERITTLTRIGDTSLRSGDQILVPERSFVVRNATLVATMLSVTASLVIALLIHH
jgi:protein involved in polysaccharide export with SLBB domain